MDRKLYKWNFIFIFLSFWTVYTAFESRHFEFKIVVKLINFSTNPNLLWCLFFYAHFKDLFCIFVYKSTRFLVTRRQSLIVMTRPSHALQRQPSKLRIKQKDIHGWHDLTSFYLLNNDSTLFKIHNYGKLKILIYKLKFLRYICTLLTGLRLICFWWFF